MRLLLALLIGQSGILGQRLAQEPDAGRTELLLAVRDHLGQALDGIRIEVFWGFRGADIPPGMPIRGSFPDRSSVGITAAEGRCRLPVRPGEPLLLYLEASRRNRWTRHEVERPLSAGEVRELTLRALPPTLLVSGRVVDQRGRPVAGATVDARWEDTGWRDLSKARLEFPDTGPARESPSRSIVGWESVTDQDGRYRLEGLRPGESVIGHPGTFFLTASAPGRIGLRRAAVHLAQAGATAEGVKLRLGIPRWIRGLVLDSRGQPVAGAAVRAGLYGAPGWESSGILGVAYLPPETFEGLTDAEGRFSVPSVARERWHLSATHPDSDARVTAEVGAHAEEVVLRFEAPEDPVSLTLEGRVLSWTGEPLGGALVRVNQWMGSQVETDSEGRFLLTDLPAGIPKVGLKFLAEGHAVHEVWPVALVPRRPPLQVRLPREERIEGRLVDEDGRPVASRSVYLGLDASRLPEDAEYPAWERLESQFGIDASRTDDQGRFRFSNLRPAPYLLEVKGRGGQGLVCTARVTGGDREVVLVLGQGLVTLRGRVVHAHTGAPVAGFFVHPARHQAGSSSYHRDLRHWADDPEGRFVFRDLPEGTWTVYVEAEGLVSEETPEREYPAGEHDLTVRMAPPRSLPVRVVDLHGNPVSRAFLDATSVEGRMLGAQVIEPLGMSDAGGDAVLEGVPAARTSVYVWPPGLYSPYRIPVDAGADQEEPVLLELPIDLSSTRYPTPIALLEHGEYAEPAFVDGSPGPGCDWLQEWSEILALDPAGNRVAHWKIARQEEGWSITPGHELSSFLDPKPVLERPVIPFELPVGGFRILVTAEGYAAGEARVRVTPRDWDRPAPEPVPVFLFRFDGR